MRLSLLLPSVLAIAAVSHAKAHGSSEVTHRFEKRTRVQPQEVVERSLANASTDISLHHAEKRTLNLLCSLLGIGCPVTVSVSYPTSSWKCNGSGNDGYSYDYNKKSCPSTYPSGYKYFGSGYGWLPPKGWSVPSNTWAPYSSFGSDCSKATWFAPSASWQYPSGFSIPSFWLNLGWNSYKGPSQSWSCSGSGDDGWDYDSAGSSCPSSYPSGWKYFGKSHGWGPTKGWNVPSDSWTYPSSCLSTVSLFNWWCPSDSWTVTSGLTIPSFWGSLGWSQGGGSNGWPSESWQCSGSGNDGYDYDHTGASCPYGNGFKWFGSNYGWQPEKGWTGASGSWSAPSAWLPTCSKATWWAPQSSWVYPASFVWPSFWVGLGWSGYNWAPSSYVCNGKGTDGYKYDHLGNGLPSGFPSGWLYFGISAQWQPVSGWKLPSKKWSPPGAWSPSHATWWSPSSTWNVPSGFACPTWWSVSFLNPLAGILSWL